MTKNGTTPTTDQAPPLAVANEAAGKPSLTPTQRQRAVEDIIAAAEAQYSCRVMGVIKTVTGRDGQPVQMILWEVAALPGPAA